MPRTLRQSSDSSVHPTPPVQTYRQSEARGDSRPRETSLCAGASRTAAQVRADPARASAVARRATSPQQARQPGRAGPPLGGAVAVSEETPARHSYRVTAHNVVSSPQDTSREGPTTRIAPSCARSSTSAGLRATRCTACVSLWASRGRADARARHPRGAGLAPGAEGLRGALRGADGQRGGHGVRGDERRPAGRGRRARSSLRPPGAT